MIRIGNLNRPLECPECVAKRLLEQEHALVSQNGQDALESRLRASGVGKRHLSASFDNYVVENEGQKNAVAQCMWLLKHFDYTTGLIFLGEKGTGKNHLAISLIREVLLLGKKAKIVTFMDFMREIKDGYSTKESELDIIKRFTKLDLLVIDELGRQFQSETEMIMLHDLIDKRYLAMKPTVLITNMDIKQLEEVTDTPALDRFTEGPQGKKTVHFNWESYRNKKRFDK